MRSEETQTLCAGCSKAEPKIPQQTSVRTAQDGQNLISWRRSSPTNPVWWRSMHTISSYRGNRPTHTDRQDHLQYTAPQLACSVVRERERQTDRERLRQRQTYRQTYRQTEKQTERQRDRQSNLSLCARLYGVTEWLSVPRIMSIIWRPYSSAPLEIVAPRHTCWITRRSQHLLTGSCKRLQI